MSYFAVAVVRGVSGWTASEFDLRGVEDIEDVGGALRDLADGESGLLFVEADDEYLVILRTDGGADLRVFGSDAKYAEASPLGEVLLGDLEPEDTIDLDDETDDEDRPAADPGSTPVGEADLLKDLGIPPARLLALCTQEGLLPEDITTAICERLGCVDEVDKLR